MRQSAVTVLLLTVLFAAPAYGAEQKAVFAGGCFWGVEAVFEHVKGVIAVRSGYAGGTKETANYESVTSGATKHAESVEIRFDPTKIKYEQLLFIFFAVAHDPTEVDRQGPDVGPQYRSAIFYLNENQKKLASSFMQALTASNALDKPIATKMKPLVRFFPAEDYHQDYVQHNPGDRYVQMESLPRLKRAQKAVPELVKAGKFLNAP